MSTMLSQVFTTVGTFHPTYQLTDLAAPSATPQCLQSIETALTSGNYAVFLDHLQTMLSYTANTDLDQVRKKLVSLNRRLKGLSYELATVSAVRLLNGPSSSEATLRRHFSEEDFLAFQQSQVTD